MDQTRKTRYINEIAEKAIVSAVLLAITIPVFYGGEALIARRHSDSVPWLITRWDAKIPLVPPTVWIYMSWYLAPWLVLALPARQFRRIASAIVLAFTVCMICYALIPAAVERPVVMGHTLSERALLFLYRHDPPSNIFPSFHAALCVVLWRSAQDSLLRSRLMTIWMAAICVACVLTKQHNILDIPAGMAVGFAALSAVSAVLIYFERSKVH